MKEHIYPVFIGTVSDELVEAYNANAEDCSFDELKVLGDGMYPYLFRVVMPAGTMGFGVGTYDYVINVDDVSEYEFSRVRDRYRLRQDFGSDRPDINMALLLIGADMLGKTIDELDEEEFAMISLGAAEVLINEVSLLTDDEYDVISEQAGL